MGPKQGGSGANLGSCEGGVNAFHSHAACEDLEGGWAVAFGAEFGEGLVEFTRLGAGDDFDDIRAVGRADLDLESAFVGAGDIDGFVSRDEGVSGEAVRKEDDCGAIALVAEHGDVALARATDSEGYRFAAGIGALAIDGEDFDGKIHGNTREAVFGDLLEAGEALLDILRLDGLL